MIELAKRAVACKGWRWWPGMLDTEGRRMLAQGKLSWQPMSDPGTPPLPDLSDPATVGCLLFLVREAVGDPGAAVWRAKIMPGEPEYWEVSDCPAVLPRTFYGCGNTEAGALIFALEGASA